MNEENLKPLPLSKLPTPTYNYLPYPSLQAGSKN